MVVKLVLDSLKMVPQQIHFEDILSLHNFSVHFVSKLNYGHFFQIFLGFWKIYWYLPSLLRRIASVANLLLLNFCKYFSKYWHIVVSKLAMWLIFLV